MARLVGIDYGTRRIGLALCDSGERLASPAETLPGAGSVRDDARRVAAWMDAQQAEAAVVGLPLNMDGTSGPQAALTQGFIKALREAWSAPVHVWDERLSSFAADQALDALRAAGRRLTAAKRRAQRDRIAAQVILQSFLDARRAGPSPPDDSPL